VAYKKLGAIRGAAGVIGDNYYVIEQDYGTRFNLSNSIKTIVSVFSISNLKLKKRLDLSSDVASSGKEANKIIFTEIVTWKDRLIAFYTYKGTGKNFLANALVYDADGKVVRDQSIGEFPFDNTLMGTGIFNGRGKMSLSEGFHLRFTPDSSRMIILTSPHEKSSNVVFKVYKPDLVLEKDVSANLPLDKTKGELIEFLMNNEGSIYALARTEKSRAEKKEDEVGDHNYYFYSLNLSNSSQVKQQRLSARDKAIVTIGFGLSAKGKPICMGFFNNPEVKKAEGQAHGAFSILPINNSGTAPVLFLKPIADSNLKKRLWEKDYKKGFGLDAKIQVVKTVPRTNGGVIAICRYDHKTMITRGTTGAMSSTYEQTSFPTLLFIDEEGKIILDEYHSNMRDNKEFATRTGRLEYFFENNSAEAFNFYMSKDKKWGLNITKIAANKIDEPIQVTEVPNSAWFMAVQDSVFPLRNNEYIGTCFAGDNTGSDAINIFRVSKKL
jgi:hypothetical protein